MKRIVKKVVLFALIICCLLPSAYCWAQGKSYSGLLKNCLKNGKFILLTDSQNRDLSDTMTVYPVCQIGEEYFRCLGFIERQVTDENADKYSFLKVTMKHNDPNQISPENTEIKIERKLDSIQVFDVLLSLADDNKKAIRFQREKVHESSLGSKIYQLNINDYYQIGAFTDPERLDLIKNYLINLKSKSNMLQSAFLSGNPIKITFNNGTVVEGILDYRDKSSLDQMLNISDSQSEISFQKYAEFEAVRYKDVPYVLKDWPAKENFSKKTVTRLIANGKKIKRQGLFTNRFTWMGRNNHSGLDNFYISCGLLNDYQEISLYSAVIIDSELNSTSMFINDIANIKSIERFPFQIDDYHRLFNEIRDIHESLRTCWEERNSENMYVEFHNSPAFKGKLVEYVQGYHLSSIPHAVLKDDNNRFVILRSPSDIKSLALESEFSQAEIQELYSKIIFDQTPAKTVAGYIYTGKNVEEKNSLKKAAKIVSDKFYTEGIELQITNAELCDSILPPQTIVDKIEFNPDVSLLPCVIDISLTDKTVSEQSPRWIFFEEFSVFDKSEKSLDKLALINPDFQSLTDVINMEKESISLKLLVYVPVGTSTIYLKYIDMNPVEINFVEQN